MCSMAAYPIIGHAEQKNNERKASTMHMADALLAPAVAATMYVASAATVGVSIAKLRKEEKTGLESTSKKLPAMAVMAALVFAGQMINYSIPGTGSSGHMCGGMMLSGVLGPWAGFLSMVVILTIQCLFFADGGLMALGANCWNMAFYGCFVGYFLIYRPIMQGKMFASKGTNAANRLKIIIASILGCVITLQLGAFSVVLETTASGITELPFGAFCALMQPIHLAIGLIEGVITAAVLLFIYETRPELLKDVKTDGEVKNKCSLKTTIIILAVVVAIVGGGLSLIASSNPDGLEWTLFHAFPTSDASCCTGFTGNVPFVLVHATNENSSVFYSFVPQFDDISRAGLHASSTCHAFLLGNDWETVFVHVNGVERAGCYAISTPEATECTIGFSPVKGMFDGA